MTFSPIDHIRAAMAAAVAADLDALDLLACAEIAASPEGFADAVENIIRAKEDAAQSR
jgi:hypothetical protein